MTETPKISFLQVAHLPDDDRVWFHQTKTLKENGFDVSVVSTRTNHSELENVFCFDDSGMKKCAVNKKIADILSKINPDIIICDNPLSVFFASNFKKKKKLHIKIIIDVTEWYPSKKNLANLTGTKRFIKKIVLQCVNFFCGFWIDGFILGEEDKAKLFKKYFKRKPYLELPYYPDLKYIKKGKTKNDFSTWNFLYSGLLNKDKGFYNVFVSVKMAALENLNFKFFLTIISNDIVNEEQKLLLVDMPNNLKIKFLDYLPFEKFCTELINYDIFFDLREKDEENNRCLPIKLFYYMACGRPSIFSDLDAIKRQVPEINEFASLTNPNDYNNISQLITAYITNNERYIQHSEAALKFSVEKYNWKNLSEKFIDFINIIKTCKNYKF
jgi:glycosyltransferase involved in cell wall biosynthesis